MTKLKTIILSIITIFAITSCGNRHQELAVYPDGTQHVTVHKNHWTFYYPSGELFAEADITEAQPMGINWKFYNTKGEDYFKMAYDSVRVMEFGQMQTPATVNVYTTKNGVNAILEYQFFSEGSLRSYGELINNKREGKWSFYHPNGQLQTEAIFQDGIENGVYVVYRETGIPYYRGLYINGKRAGIWEIYDEDANLVTTQNYDRP